MNVWTLALVLCARTASAGVTSEFSGLGEKLADLGQKVGEVQERLSARGTPEQLFAVIEGGGKLRLRLRQNQLERKYLFSATVHEGVNVGGTTPFDMEPTFLFSFHWTGDRLQVLRHDLEHRADAGTPEGRAIERSFPPQVVATVPATLDPQQAGGVIVDADVLFLTDLAEIRQYVNEAYERRDLRLVAKESTVEKLQSFPRNLEVGVQLVFAGLSGSLTEAEKPDARRVVYRMHYSLTELPEAGYEPREADPRVGFFTTDYRDHGRPELRDRLDPAVHLVNRWRLEKKDPAAPVSEPVKPIVFWLEDTIPEEYRPAIKAGILAWNAAFEAIGFKDALVVKEVDKDMSAEERASFDPANVAYNMVRWFMGEDAGFAIGPRRVNPLTGEIFNATVSISDEMARFLADEAAIVPEQPKPSARGAAKAKGASSRGSAAREQTDRMAAEARLGLAALEARGALSPEELKRFKDEYLTELVAHEIGHNLGLRHNFKASSTVPPEELGKNGVLSGSVMDYDAVHIAPKGQPQGPYFMTKVGAYDRWAIEFGYKPTPGGAKAAQDEAARVAARSAADPRLAYATDEDLDGRDPDAQQFDLGQGAVDFARSRVELAQDLWSRLEKDSSSGADELRRRFASGMAAYNAAARVARQVVGGLRTSRQPSGEVYEPVTAEEERDALKFLNESVFSSEPFQVPPELLRRMGRDRLADADDPNEPLAVDRWAHALQVRALDDLFSGETMKRLLDREKLAADPKEVVTLRQVMASVRAGVWAGIGGKSAPEFDALQRELQREHVEYLDWVANNPDADVPGDARSVARAELVRLLRQIRDALREYSFDSDTRAHLEYEKAFIDKALKDKWDA